MLHEANVDLIRFLRCDTLEFSLAQLRVVCRIRSVFLALITWTAYIGIRHCTFSRLSCREVEERGKRKRKSDEPSPFPMCESKPDLNPKSPRSHFARGVDDDIDLTSPICSCRCRKPHSLFPILRNLYLKSISSILLHVSILADPTPLAVPLTILNLTQSLHHTSRDPSESYISLFPSVNRYLNIFSLVTDLLNTRNDSSSSTSERFY